MASLQKNVAGQKVTFGLVNASTGAALTSATFTSLAWVTVDGTQAGFAGSFTTLGNGQYQYAPTQGETNGTNVGIFIAPSGAVPVNLDFHTDQVDSNGLLKVDTEDWKGTAVSSPATAGIPDINAKNIGGQAVTLDGNNLLEVDVADWNGHVVSSPATAGVPDVNVKNMNNVAATSIATINANQGTTQPINFTGTSGSALVKSDVQDIAGSAVSTSSAQIGVNLVDIAGSAVSTSSAQLGVNAVNIAGQAAALDGNNLLKVDAEDWKGSAVNALVSGKVDALTNIRSGTAQAGASGSITLDSGASATNNFYNGEYVLILSGTGAGQIRPIIGYVGSTKVASVTPSWATNPDNTSVFALVPAAFADIVSWLETAVTAATAGIPDVNAKNINNVSTGSVTTINANQGTTQPLNFTGTGGSALVKGDAIDINSVSASAVTTIDANIGTTQPVNFTGTGGSALVKSDMEDIAGSAVSTSSAQIGVNVVNYNGHSAQTDTNNLPKVDVEDVIGSAVSTSSAQIGVNVVDIAGEAAALDGNNLLKVDVEDINGDATAAQALKNSTNTICWGTAGAGGSSSTVVVATLNNPSSLTDSGQLIGRTIIFLGRTSTGNLQAQASNITANTTGSTPTITFTAMTHAPSAGDTFVIV